MSSSNYPNNRDLLKRKILGIKQEIQELIHPLCSEKFDVIWYGAYDVDPKHLVYWICVQTDKVKDALTHNRQLNKELKLLLEKYEYPGDAQRFVSIGFESQETVDRESNRNWWYHFK